jgi:hypothetical protein
MSRTHAAASAISYGMRYLMVMVFCLAIDRDDDGNAAGKRQSSASLKKSGVWDAFSADVRGARSVRELEAVKDAWRPRARYWSPGFKQGAQEILGQAVERLGGTLRQLEESARYVDEEGGQ